MPIWTGAGADNNWSTAGNWDTGLIPTTTTDAIFSSSFNVPCVVDGTAATVRECQRLIITSGYTSNITLSGSIRSGVSTTGGITIDGTPTFLLGTPSGSLRLFANTGNIRSISSSAAVIIPRLSEQMSNATLDTSGSIIVNNLGFNHGGAVLTIRGVGFTASNGTISGDGTGWGVSGTPGLFLSQSVNWNYITAVPLNITISANCNFTQSSNLYINSRTLFVDSTSTITCSTSSIVQFVGNCTMSMNNSTTNRFNSLQLLGANLNLPSDVYLVQNTGSLSTTSRIGQFDWSGANTLTGNKIIYVGGNLGTFNNQPLSSTRYSAGGSKIVLYGTGYIGSSAGNTNTFLDVDISSSFPIQLGAPNTNVNWLNSTNTIRYITASSFVASNSSSLTAGVAASPGTILDFQGQAIYNLNHNGLGNTIFLSSSLICSGNYTTVGGVNTVNNSTLEVQRNIIGVFNGQQSGTAAIIIGGNTPTTYSIVSNNTTTINKTAGGNVLLQNISGLAAGLSYGASTFTYTAGTINPGTSTMTIGSACTLNGMTWYNLTVPGAFTVTMDAANTIQNNLTLGSTGNTAFTGSAGWTCANLICSNTSRTITLGNSSTGASYRTTTNASLTATAAAPILMTSDNATTRSLWTLDYGAQQQLIYVSGTRIDSSQGQTIWSFGAALTNTVNWATGSRPGTTAYTFVV